ncbi:uncharacterized protein LOC129289678 [Prosopis cineraria]|uniref:uncharacterized protein LOC129289678 n=1 Tax=Prosopis cineraria TaxID=364024 RepID=UPI0024104156|nr:uncharacterized protein LOC129289678 [Prosopis cineraria]
MEGSKGQAAPQVSDPPSTAPTLPPQPPPPAASAALPPKSKKRPLESDAHLQNSRLFKIRAIIRDLRPRFIEVLRTPDFQKCQASNEIREQLKTLVELCKQNVQESKASSGENLEGKTPLPGRQSESKISAPVALEKQQVEDGQSQGTYIVGGSAFGWNFITYPGKPAVYYGITKEQFRAKHPLPCLASD